jgi:hypothetical protein
MDKPMPIPDSLLVWNGLNILPIMSAFIPGPLSVTVTSIESSSYQVDQYLLDLHLVCHHLAALAIKIML